MAPRSRKPDQPKPTPKPTPKLAPNLAPRPTERAQPSPAPATPRGNPIELLRTWRVRPERDLSLADVLAPVQRDLKRRARTMGAATTAWCELVPVELQRGSALVGLSRGVLGVRAQDSATHEALARWLRQGGELELVKRCPGGLLRVRVTF